MSEEVEGHPRRLSISEETLRLQLAELELRLRIFFAEQLEKKANALDLELLKDRATAVESGVLTPAMRRSMVELIEEENDRSATSTWTSRERLVMVVGMLVTVAMLAISGWVVTHAQEPHASDKKVIVE